MPVLFSGDKKILYIHVPKTGGVSVENFLRQYGTIVGVRDDIKIPKGFPCSVQHFHGTLLESIFSTDESQLAHDFNSVIMTVRNPLSRVISEYKYQKMRNKRLGGGVFPGFHQWWKESLDKTLKDPYHADNHFRPQNEFEAFNPTIFKLEEGLTSVEAHIEKILERSGSLPIQYQNESLVEVSSPSVETIASIQKFYSTDYDKYGYSKIYL